MSNRTKVLALGAVVVVLLSSCSRGNYAFNTNVPAYLGLERPHCGAVGAAFAEVAARNGGEAPAPPSNPTLPVVADSHKQKNYSVLRKAKERGIAAVSRVTPATLFMPPKAVELGQRLMHRLGPAVAFATGLSGPGTQTTEAFAPLKKTDAGLLARLGPRKEQPLPRQAEPGRTRSKAVAFGLALLLGIFGAHLLYLGYRGRALAYLLSTLAGIGAGLLAIPLANSVQGNPFGGVLVGLAVLLVGLSIFVTVYLASLVDAVRIATGDLKPKDGEYFPRFFQLRPDPTATAGPK